MKKILIMLLSAALICSASACAQGGNQNSPEQAQTTSESETTAPEETTAEAGITPLMWKVTDAEGHTAYMLGSAHFADEAIFEMPEYFEKAYSVSDCVAFETLGGAASSDDSMIYSDGTTIRDHVSEEAYSFAKEILTEQNQYSNNMDKLKPAAWLNQLESIKKHRSGCFYSVDGSILDRAQSDLKEMVSLESDETHSSYFGSQPEDVQEWLFSKEANEEAFNDDSKGKLKYEKWKKGTITYEDEVPPFEELSDAQLDALGEQERTDYVMNKKYVSWLVDVNTKRNREMTETILKTMSEDKHLLAVAGVMHFLCENNITELLREQGCTVEQYP